MEIIYLNKTIEDIESYHKKLLICEATNTRLMGVTFVHTRWELTKDLETIFLDQFFYFDAEEYGFDTYKEVISTNPKDEIPKQEIENNINKMAGALGGKLVKINLTELKALLNYYYNFSKERKDTIPGPCDNYRFLLDKTTLNNNDLYTLYQKICVDLVNDYELIHYYMMRLIGKDYSPLPYLSSKNIDLSQYDKLDQGALFKETIELIDERTFSKDDNGFETFDKEKTYLVSSLVLIDDTNYLIKSKIKVIDKHITGIELLSDIILLHSYAEELINEKEYIVEYSYNVNIPINDIRSELTKKAMVTTHDLGKTYMIFNDNNNHVREETYLISNDTFGTYYLSEYGELLIRTTNKKNIAKLKKDLYESNIGEDLSYVSLYEDSKQAFLDYIYSGEYIFSLFFEDYEDEK